MQIKLKIILCLKFLDFYLLTIRLNTACKLIFTFRIDITNDIESKMIQSMFTQIYKY